MTIRFERPEFHASVAEVRRAAESLTAARARASGEVDDLLGSWHGAAADAFAEGWADWLEAAAAVAGSLDGLSTALAQVLATFTTCDGSVATVVSSVVSSVGPS